MTSAQDLYEQGQLALAAGEQTKAYNLFIEAIEADEDFVDAWAALLPLADAETQGEIRAQIEALDPDHPSLGQNEPALAAAADEFDPRSMLMDDEPASGPAEMQGLVIEEADSEATSASSTAADLMATASRFQSQLEGGLSAVPGGDRELIPGISLRTALIYGAGLLIFTVCMISFTALVTSTRANRIAVEQTITARRTENAIQFSNEQTAVSGTAIAQQTSEFFALTRASELATQDARVAIASITIPPSLTPTDTPTVPVFRVAPLPPENIGITGQIVVWGGNNPANNGFFQALTFTPTNPRPERRFTPFVQDLTMARDGSRFVYRGTNSVGDEALFEVASGTSSSPRSLSPAVRGDGLVGERGPSADATGGQVIMIAESSSRSNTSAYLLNIDGQDVVLEGGESPVTLLTNDDANYSSVAISPDASRAVAVRRGSGGTDMVLIDLNDPAFPQTFLTQDGDMLREEWPYFSADGQQVVYSAAPNTDPENHDLYVIPVNTPGSGNAVLQEDGDQIHPVFSPDSRFVAYASNEVADEYNLFVYDLITMTKYQITEDTRNPFFPGAWVTSISGS